MLDVQENVGVLLTKLQGEINSNRHCEGTSKFIESVTDLTRNFRDYFHCASRQINAQSLINIQAEIELSEKNLKEFENLSRNLFNVVFTLKALGIEIEKMKLSLELLYKQVEEFWNAVKTIQDQNMKIIKILTEVWKVLSNLKKHLYVLNRHQKEFIEKNLEMGMISFADYISCSANEELNSMLKSMGNSAMYFSETVRQMKYLNYLIFNHQKLKSIHTLFSFQLLMLINNPYDDKQQAKKDSKLKKCFGKCCFKSRSKKPPFVNMSEMGMIGLEKQTLQIGNVIHDTTREVREVHCASIRREEIVLTDIQAKRMVLLRGLNELQMIVAAFSEMEKANDNLIGKTVKIRPLFKNIQEFLKLDLSELKNLVNETITTDST